MTRRIAKLSGLLGAVLLVGCASDIIEMPSIESPSLQLEPPRTPSNLPRGDYTLTNGAGETLLEAKDVAPRQEHEARFDLDKLDGTINVAVTKDGKTIYTQTLHHPPGKRVRLEWNIEHYRFDLTEVETPRSQGPKAEGGGSGKD